MLRVKLPTLAGFCPFSPLADTAPASRAVDALATARLHPTGMLTLREPKTPPEIVQLARSGQVLEPGWGKSKRKLATVGACRQEAARLYHQAAAGRILPEDLSRGIYALDKIARMAEVAQLEKRVQQLEAQLEEKAGK